MYLYDDEPPRVKFVKQNETLIIKPPQELTTPADYREKFQSEVRSPLAQGETSEELNIIAAVYGLEDHTDKVRNLVEHPTGVLSTQASNKVFGNTWKGKACCGVQLQGSTYLQCYSSRLNLLDKDEKLGRA